jgi:hypothetical protein
MDTDSFIAGLLHAQTIACDWHENERSAEIRQESEAVIRRVQETGKIPD